MNTSMELSSSIWQMLFPFLEFYDDLLAFYVLAPRYALP